MATNSRRSQDLSDDTPLIKWLKRPANYFGTIIAAFATIFSSGFAVGTYYKGTENRLEIMELKQKHNEEIQTEKDKYRQLENDIYKKSIAELTEFVNSAQKNNNEQ